MKNFFTINSFCALQLYSLSANSNYRKKFNKNNFVFIHPIYVIILASTFSSLASEIKILCTAALINNQYEMRKHEYIDCLQRLSHFGYQPLVVESCVQGPTFLDTYATVFYSQTNNFRLKNKGVNEAISLLAAFPYYNFQDDDMIIKLTGRYYFYSDQFLKVVTQHPEIDIFVKEFSDGQMCTSCFAIRFKLLKELLTHIDYSWMEHNMVNIERIFADYVNTCISHNISVKKVSMLGLKVNCFGTGNCVLMNY